jgi:hypothetical protein
MADRIDEEWLAQDTALRDGHTPADRLLAHVLAEPPLAPLPDNFAAQVALMARQPQAADDRAEAMLQYGLLGLLALAGIGVAWPLLTEPQVAMPGDASMPGWLTLVLLCLALSAAPSFLGSRLR